MEVSVGDEAIVEHGLRCSVSTRRPTPVELAAKLRPEMREHVANMKPLSKASSSRVKSTTATSLFESCLLDADEQ